MSQNIDIADSNIEDIGGEVENALSTGLVNQGDVKIQRELGSLKDILSKKTGFLDETLE